MSFRKRIYTLDTLQGLLTVETAWSSPVSQFTVVSSPEVSRQGRYSRVAPTVEGGTPGHV